MSGIRRRRWREAYRSSRGFGALFFLLFEAVFGAGDDDAEGFRLVHGQIGEDLAVERDVGGGQPGDEAAVKDVVLLAGGTDALNPEAAKGTLAGLAVTRGVLLGLVDGVLGVAVELGAVRAKAFGAFQHALAAFTAGGGVSGAWHGSVSLSMNDLGVERAGAQTKGRLFVILSA